jgi:PST family polysaccharide transporter
VSQSVLEKSARGSIVHLAVSAVTLVLGFVRAVLLTRLLSPQDFGVVALALFFNTFITPFAVLGIDNALIQKKDLSPESFSTHFLLRTGLGAGLLLLGFLVSPVLRHIYADRQVVVDVLLVLLAINLLDATFATGNAIVRRELRYGTVALLNLASSIAMTITAPLLAYLGAGLWSLVAEQAVGPMVRWLGFWLFIRPWKPSFRFSLAEAQAQIRFGAHLVYSNLLGILLDRFDDFWTGSALGTTALGYYSRAYELAQYPERVLATPITNVFFTTYAAVQENALELSKAFFRSSSFLIRAGLWMAVGLLAGAPELVEILFGRVWLPIVPVFRLMLVYLVLSPIYNNASYLVIGAGRPHVLTNVRLLQAGLFVLAVIAFAYLWGINGVAIAADLMMLTGTVILYGYSRRITQFSMKEMFFWPTVAALLAAAAAFSLERILLPGSLWQSLLLKGSAITLIYALALYIPERQWFHKYGLKVLKPYWEPFWTRFR